MDGRGGCCIARYGGGGAAVYDVSKIDQIMLRFRPIAPKPTASGAVSGGVTAAESNDSKGLRTGRGRRRRNGNNGKSKSKSSSSSGENNSNSSGSKRCNRKRKPGAQEGSTEKLLLSGGVQDNGVVTLPLLPETPDLTAGIKLKGGQKKLPVMLSFDGSSGDRVGQGTPSTWKRQKRVVGSWVIVERVTSTWAVDDPGALLMMGNRMSSDEEKRRVLEDDTCPGFVTDCWNRVWWTNGAYKKMAREKGVGGSPETASSLEEEVVVWLVMKEKLPAHCEGFTCRVTVQSTWSQLSSTVTVPCDAWRLSDGGFAWRLDVKAALSLGR